MKNEELHDIVRTLHNTIDEKDLKLNQNMLEREKNKQKLAMHTMKMTQELDDKLRRQRHLLQAEMQAKDAKLLRVKEILDTEMQSPVPTVAATEATYEPQQTPPKLEESLHHRNNGRDVRHRRFVFKALSVITEGNAIKDSSALGRIFINVLPKMSGCMLSYIYICEPFVHKIGTRFGAGVSFFTSFTSG